jgi:leader peptidase (prepilin peptidase)/N-methyltransferase
VPLNAGHIPRWLIFGWTFLVGAAVGSFLNVVVARVPAGESIVWPGSRCPRCRTPIRWHDNLPLVSWVLLRGRCRTCGVRISARYPLVEALGAGMAVIAVARHGLGGAAAAELAFAAALIALALIDLDAWLLPNSITWPLLAFGLAMSALGVTPAGSLRAAAYGAGLGFAAFAAIAWIGEKVFAREALGLGDVWLLAALGAWFGPAALLPIVLLASLQGSVVGLALIALGKGQPGPQPTAAANQEPPHPDDTLGAREPSPPEGGEPPTSTATPTPTPTSTTTSTATSSATSISTPTSTATPTPTPTSTTTSSATTTSTSSATTTSTSTSTPTANTEPPPPPDAADEDDWVPPRHSVPFGPFLVAGALEWLWLGGALATAFPMLRLFR